MNCKKNCLMFTLRVTIEMKHDESEIFDCVSSPSSELRWLKTCYYHITQCWWFVISMPAECVMITSLTLPVSTPINKLYQQKINKRCSLILDYHNHQPSSSSSAAVEPPGVAADGSDAVTICVSDTDHNLDCLPYWQAFRPHHASDIRPSRSNCCQF